MASMRWVGASGVDGAALLAKEAHEQVKVVQFLKREPIKRGIYPKRDSDLSPRRDRALDLRGEAEKSPPWLFAATP